MHGTISGPGTGKQTGAELRQLTHGSPSRLLGVLHTGNMNVYLDRQHRKDPESLGRFPDQPTLMEMTQDALNVLQQNPNEFFLMIEAASTTRDGAPAGLAACGDDTIGTHAQHQHWSTR